MKWRDARRSDNVEDQRGSRVGRAAPMLGGGAILVIALFALLTGQDPQQIADIVAQVPTASGGAASSGAPPPEQDEAAQFVSVVLADTEDTWSALFTQSGSRYQPPALVLFSDAVQSACGFSSSAVGPFYCPADQKLYLDLAFFRELAQRFGAPGDFAAAYVVAHEVGHHIQTLTGISRQVGEMGQRMSEEGRNRLSVLQELQADCYAGVWGYHANRQRHMLEPGDVEEGLAAAAAIGDDTLQRGNGGAVHPESWTHGSSQQRTTWLNRGLKSGRIEDCDTFNADGI